MSSVESIDSLTFGKIETAQQRTEFLRAWETAFARQLDSSIYNWIFNDRNDLYAVFDGERVAAGYGMLRQAISFEGSEALGMLCNNVFVCPEYQAKNLFVRVGRFALSEAEKQGIKMAIGMPNKNAIPGHKRVGWTFPGAIHFLEAKPTDLKLPSTSTELIALSKEKFSQFADALDRFAREMARDRGFSVLKTKEYFSWRYLQRPLTTYSIFLALNKSGVVDGYVVYKFFAPANRLHIVDLEARDQNAFKQLLSRGPQVAPAATLVNTWGSTVHREKFLASGFKVSEEMNELIMIYPYNKTPVTFKNPVHVVLGDNDVF